MTTKTITRTQVIAALNKDLALLTKQHDCIKLLVALKAGQFLNVGNDEWCGGAKEVLKLYRYAISFANRVIKKLSAMKDEKFYPEMVDHFWYTGNRHCDLASESIMFLWTSPSEGWTHHSLFPNVLKLLGR